MKFNLFPYLSGMYITSAVLGSGFLLHPLISSDVGRTTGRVLAQFSFISLSQPGGVTTAQPAIWAKNCIFNHLANKHMQLTGEIAPHFTLSKSKQSWVNVAKTGRGSLCCLASSHYSSSPASQDVADRVPGVFVLSLPTMPTKTESLCCRDFHCGLLVFVGYCCWRQCRGTSGVCATAQGTKLHFSKIKKELVPTGREQADLCNIRLLLQSLPHSLTSS